MAAECTISLMAIPRGLASREQRDANPRRMAQHKKQKKSRIGHSALVFAEQSSFVKTLKSK